MYGQFEKCVVNAKNFIIVTQEKPKGEREKKETENKKRENKKNIIY